ncbi:DNA mismatch repair protein MutT [Candidatus Gracilibacteria bacterium CG17_big_fil_post_rev_8_21_14_2_50_48_13]|nr:MAG: DNA mismatch repair protein MutT [Candidatus Gracilibacteria bacterium CG17_big_fil_post_rev_8_21_14_2_50_48_13]
MNTTLTSAGGVISRIQNGVLELLVLEYPNGRIAFPKGRQDPGETLEETALREVEEETGCKSLSIQKKLGDVTYVSENPAQAMYTKTMHIFAMRALSRPKIGEDKAIWLPFAHAKERMVLPGERAILKEHADFLRQNVSPL